MLTVGTESCLGCWWWLRAVEVAVAARSHGLHLHRAACMTRRLQKLQVMRRPAVPGACMEPYTACRDGHECLQSISLSPTG